MSDAPVLNCPWCSAPMRSGPAPKSAVSTCYECWGLWLDTAMLCEAGGKHQARGRLFQAIDALDPAQTEIAGILCPVCPDTRLLVQKIRAVEIDWCPRCHGIFLDKGERERLVEDKTAPGLGPLGMPPKSGEPSGGSSSSGLWAAGELFGLLVELVSDL